MAKKVTIYTTAECPWCKRTKEFFKENKVEYSEKNVGDDQEAAQEMIKKSGQQGVPVIDIDGKIVVGFDEEKLRELLEIK
tara:strand:+ start:1894 stop:2133 length:240 start_codon:yes stop_codon:yes gene_type:complete